MDTLEIKDVQLGTNIKYSIEGDEYVIRINRKNVGTLSKTGKSNVIAGTAGFQSLALDGHRLSLNLIGPKS